jgi:AcrR family transcriptional regulator
MHAASDLFFETDNQVPRGAGRPRSEDCRQKVLTAADALVARDGFARLSIDGIAQLAGVSKATIYRWWPNKAAIVMEALLASTEADVFVPTSPDPEEDLVARIRRTIALFRSPKGRILASLIGEAQFNAEVGEAYRKTLLGPRREALRRALERAVNAGILRPELDLDIAMDLIYGPLYERLLFSHAPFDEAFERDYPTLAVALLRNFSGTP